MSPERRVKKSHPDYAKLNDLADKIAKAKNPHLFKGDIDMDNIEYNALQQILEDAMADELEGGRFADFMTILFQRKPLDKE